MLLYRLEDKRIQSFFLGGRYPKLEEVRAVLEAVPADNANATTAKIIGEVAQVAAKRTDVILHLLREARLIAGTRKGLVRKYTDPLSDGEIGMLLKEYEERGSRDHERLNEMMHYAETAGCRTQVLREHFGEHLGEPCGRCDNCLRGTAEHEQLQLATSADRKRQRGGEGISRPGWQKRSRPAVSQPRLPRRMTR